MSLGAFLAIGGGVAMCFIVLYAVVYLPLHYDVPLLFGEGPKFGDLLAFVCGALAIFLGVLTLRRSAARSQAKVGVAIVAAGLAVLIVALIWIFAENLGLDDEFQQPFYFGFVYFCRLGSVHVGGSYADGYVQVPLMAGSVAALFGGVLIAAGGERRAESPVWR